MCPYAIFPPPRAKACACNPPHCRALLENLNVIRLKLHHFNNRPWHPCMNVREHTHTLRFRSAQNFWGWQRLAMTCMLQHLQAQTSNKTLTAASFLLLLVRAQDDSACTESNRRRAGHRGGLKGKNRSYWCTLRLLQYLLVTKKESL